MRTQSTTDIHWNERPTIEHNSERVNIADVTQRRWETDHILENLDADSRILEVGCGNGVLTRDLRRHVKFVDGFDFAETMVQRARQEVGESNNRFFHDDLLAPTKWKSPYDGVVCVRVLINLRNWDEQRVAVENMSAAIHPGGKLILVEGYSEGFQAINHLRNRVGLGPLEPATINYYSQKTRLREVLMDQFDLVAEFDSGLFDVLTRVVYPLLVGEENATGHSEFHERVEPLIRSMAISELRKYARVVGLVLVKK